MMMINKVILCGNIGRPPKVSRAQNGREIASFALATKTFWKTSLSESEKHGESKGRSITDWHNIMVFRESVVEWVKSTLKQGDTVLVEGKLTYHKWTDKYGRVRLTPHVVISGQIGKILHIRSSKVQSQHETSQENTLISEEEFSQEEDICSPFDPSEEVFPCPQNNANETRKVIPNL